ECPDIARAYLNKIAQQKLSLEALEADREDRSSEDSFPGPDNGSDWETHVDYVETVERTKFSGLTVYLVWKNGQKTVHHSTEVYSKCPQKMLDFYEKHSQMAGIEVKPHGKKRQGRLVSKEEHT
ncbi:hypothetical protein BDF14DRAFT_1721596, partial [Spinellus fusiger]